MHELMRACASCYTRAFLLQLCETDFATQQVCLLSCLILHVIIVVSPIQYLLIVHFLYMFLKQSFWNLVLFFVSLSNENWIFF